ncbi:DUF1549 and DUF1553 domain-containing protein [Blastopirellula sp. JC732]|uniref:DUF1549 and DUF1553 domain-containing protein n=1 Tax=Blastopirellula sediminis TaxID=2894196 RepID=A0A9X1MK37_9BACT|nr:DUF1549 and DUF1553 domain-containing protein [Blastopirellula sediminis]MCC9608600.1 DUF1549 and DUF1553 domain-containing protein [Blastopirellula sediminis]MCC9628623.1 DUF1549 and DUF1553 domain-containing protein [Blastopirellula sediminis]
MKRLLVAFVGIVCLLAGALESVRSETLPAKGDQPFFKDPSQVPDFQRHVIPLLGRLGCNGRSCHGSFQGQGGFRLSLFGFDFRMDLAGLTADDRIDRAHAADSLVLQKGTLQIDHEGGRRFEVGSWEHGLLQRWIESGAKGIAVPSKLSRLEVTPDEVVFHSNGASAALQVIAVWENGDRENVTELCRFRTNDDSVVSVDGSGVMTSQGVGDTHVVVFYDNGIAAVPVMRPRDASLKLSSHQTLAPGIDYFVNEKLDKLGIIPSDICTDAEFLRRVSIDLTGTLPTPDEVTRFLADASPEKRQRKIDELLNRPAYAAWWANKLCDFSGCNPQQQAELGQETSVQWYMWTYKRLLENAPYDELVRRIVLAEGRQQGQSYEEYAREMSSYYREQDPQDFADREFMPHYWTRRSMQKPEDAAQAFAHNFLGVRLQCAQCHKHPFAPWTQDDFKQFARFFEPIKFGVQSPDENRYREIAKTVGLNVSDKNGAPIRDDVLRHARKGRVIPWRELYVADRNSEVNLDLLRSRKISLAPELDPRTPIMEWMLEPENSYFAKAFVNRVWAGYFHVGIVDPPDDLNPANPPSHPKLLDWLTQGFVESGYDMKWLHRTIASSDAYQRSWKPNETNEEDRRNFSRAIPRRLPAEIVYDSVKQSLAASDQQQEVRTDLSRRAIGHLSMRLAGTYAMQVFGKPDRAVNCDCERSNQSTLLQSIFLQNDPLIDQRLEGSGWLEELSRQEESLTKADHPALVREAWLRTVCRLPSPDEETRALQHLSSAESTVDGMRDLLWALLNTKEYILNK